MIQPAPTSRIAPTLARGTLLGMSEATATKPAHITMGFPNTSYELHLIPEGAINAGVGKRLIGMIRAKACRIDETGTGGRFVEPVYGRPRRVQGTVVASEGGAVVVDAGMPIHVTPTDPRQKADQFRPGQFVGFDVLDGATFTQA